MSDARTWLDSARQAVALIRIIDGAQVPEMSRSDVLVLGQRLSFIIKQAEKVLNVIKVRLRTEAATKAKEVADALIAAGDTEAAEAAMTAKQTFLSDDSGVNCIVTPEPPTVELNADVDIEALKADLGSLFDTYFESDTKFKPRKDFKELVSKADLFTSAKLLKVVQVNVRSPKVGFNLRQG